MAADPTVTVSDIAQALGARHIQIPQRIVRAAVAGSWRAHLQQLDPGWIDLAYSIPLLDCDRARRELGWNPTYNGPAVLDEVNEAMSDAEYGDTPALRKCTVRSSLRSAFREKPVAYRRLP